MLTGNEVRQIRNRNGFLIKFEELNLDFNKTVVVNPSKTIEAEFWKKIIKQEIILGSNVIIVGDPDEIHENVTGDYNFAGKLAKEEILALIFKASQYVGVIRNEITQDAKYFNDNVFECA